MNNIVWSLELIIGFGICFIISLILIIKAIKRKNKSLIIAVIILLVFSCKSIFTVNVNSSKKTNIEEESSNKIESNIDRLEGLNLILYAISNSDEKLTEEFKKCLLNPTSYFNVNKEKFSNRGINDYTNDSEIQWISMVDLLIENNYSVELDWNCDKETFISSINQLSNKIVFDEKNIQYDLNIEDWIYTINCNSNDNYIGIIDINSDSYVLFISNKEDFKTLEKLSSTIGYRIYTIDK